MDFLTPTSGLVALVVILPLTALALISLRARDVRAALGLPDPSARALAWPAAALLVVAALIGLAVAQPVVARSAARPVRTDAEAFFLLDTSRSMLASVGADGVARIDREKVEALKLRNAIPEVRAGIASITDRVLPHLMPVLDASLFGTTIDQAIDIEAPPPIAYLSTGVTTYAVLSAFVAGGLFEPTTKRRLLVVLTDGESRPYNVAGIGSLLRRQPAVRLILIHVWDARERVYTNGVPEAAYQPQLSSTPGLKRLADASSGRVFSEAQLAEAIQTERRFLGSGRTAEARRASVRRSLAPFLLLGTLPSLLFLAIRRSR